MKRSELYARVWTTPMSKLAEELGISDVGLAKACRRHAIPAPPRGYWAKLKAGQKPPRVPLPTPERDVTVQFTISDPMERVRLREAKRRREESVKAAAQDGTPTTTIEFAENLDEAHQLVKATQRYCERLPKLVEKFERRGIHAWSTTKPEDSPPVERYGRYSLLEKGFLNIHASLDVMGWVLRFHATIFKGLTDGGMVISRRDPPAGRQSREDDPAIEVRFKGEVFTIEFSQGYSRVYLDADELDKTRKAHSYVSAFEHRPSENLTFRFVASEYGATKTWQGNREKLQAKVHEIVRAAFELVPLQTELRLKRESDAAIARHASEARAIQQRIIEARAEQLKQAFLMAKTDEDVRSLKEFLDRLEHTCTNFRHPFNERARVWIKIVRQELEDNDPVESLLDDCLTIPSWSTKPPAWWPAGDRWTDESGSESD